MKNTPVVKKLLLLTIIFLLLTPSISSMSMIKANLSKNTQSLGNSNPDLSVNCIKSTSSYEYGFKAGKQLKFQYKLIDVLVRIIKKDNVDEKDVQDQIDVMEQYYPFLLDEIQGLSDSTGIKFERLVKLKSFLTSHVRDACTSLAATGKATKNNEVYLMQNIDVRLGGFIGNLLWRIMGYKLWIQENTLKYKYVYFGIPVLAEIPIMNEKGLGWGGATVSITKNESRYVDGGPGVWGGAMGYAWNKLIIMTCKNVSEVSMFYCDVLKPQTEGYFWSDMCCDKEGGILNAEQTYNHLALVYGNSTDITKSPEGILWHAQHHQWLDPNQTGSILPENYPSSKMRAERARELLICNYGNITLDVCKQICRDHGGGFDPDKKDSGDICRHADSNGLGFTLFSWIIQPKSLSVYFTRGTPCHSRYIKNDFSEVFAQ